MSLKQLYESDLVAYDENEDKVYRYNLFHNSDGEFVQEIWWVLGVFVRPEITGIFKDTVSAFFVVQDRDLSASFDRYDFNLKTGDFVRRLRYGISSGLLSVLRLNVSTSRVIWSLTSGAIIQRRDLNTMEPYGESISIFQEPKFFSPDTILGARCFTIDERRNRIAIAPQGGGWSNDSVTIHDFTTGALLYHVRAASIATDMFMDDDARLYVVGAKGVITIIDYLRGRPLGVMRTFVGPLGGHGSAHNQLRAAWDYRFRRIFILARSPEETITAEETVNGASTTRIRGYFPQSRPVGLTDPLPLVTPRKGRQIPVLGHVYTEAGAPLGGRPVVASFTGPVEGAPQQLGTDGFGNAIFPAEATDAGTVNVTMETADL